MTEEDKRLFLVHELQGPLNTGANLAAATPQEIEMHCYLERMIDFFGDGRPYNTGLSLRSGAAPPGVCVGGGARLFVRRRFGVFCFACFALLRIC